MRGLNASNSSAFVLLAPPHPPVGTFSTGEKGLRRNATYVDEGA